MCEKITDFLVRILVVLLLLGMFVLLCWGLISVIQSSDNTEKVRYSDSIEQLSGKIYVYTDPETNLQYLVYTVNGGICPRLGSDGKQMNGSDSYAQERN